MGPRSIRNFNYGQPLTIVKRSPSIRSSHLDQQPGYSVTFEYGFRDFLRGHDRREIGVGRRNNRKNRGVHDP